MVHLTKFAGIHDFAAAIPATSGYEVFVQRAPIHCMNSHGMEVVTAVCRCHGLSYIPRHELAVIAYAAKQILAVRVEGTVFYSPLK